MVLDLPNEVREEDEQREGDAGPQPWALQISSSVGEEHADRNPRDQEDHGVLRHHPQTDGCAYGEPPARVLSPEQANQEIGSF